MERKFAKDLTLSDKIYQVKTVELKKTEVIIELVDIRSLKIKEGKVFINNGLLFDMEGYSFNNTYYLNLSDAENRLKQIINDLITKNNSYIKNGMEKINYFKQCNEEYEKILKANER